MRKLSAILFYFSFLITSGTPLLHAYYIPLGCEGILVKPEKLRAEIETLTYREDFERRFHLNEDQSKQKEWNCIYQAVTSGEEEWILVRQVLESRDYYGVSFSFDNGGLVPSPGTEVSTKPINPNLEKMLAEPNKRFTGYSSLVEKLGRPISEDSKKVPSQFNGGVADVLRRLEFPGLIVELLQSGEGRKEFILSAIMKKPLKSLDLPVSIGASREVVISQLGPADYDYGNTLIYFTDQAGSLNIQLKGSKVSRIEWSFNLE